MTSDHRPTTTRRRPLRGRTVDRRFVVVVVLAVLAVVLGLAGPAAWSRVTGSSAGDTSAKDRIAADPPPPLFPTSQVAGTAAGVAAQRSRATSLVRTWVAAHGTGQHDAAFVAWLEQVFPAPPADLATQMPTVVALARERTTTGVAAATWLEAFGKKDVWKLDAHDQEEVMTAPAAADLKKEEKQLLKMAKEVSDDLGTKYGSSAPYVRQPSLRTDHTVHAGQRCPCSYPSRHATAAAASRTLLGALMPERDPQYAATEAQVDYSRVYMAGHFPGDIDAGALLGDVVGDYFLLTRHDRDPARLP